VLTIDSNVWVAAYDPHDRFHEASTAFLRAALDRGRSFTGPAFVAVEAACALARRTGDAAVGRRAYDELRANPSLALEPLTPEFLAATVRLGTERGLRAADAMYAAAAERTGTTLVSWEDELVRRAQAVTPDTWLET
jgi:predicted nucleic acid-binding protein